MPTTASLSPAKSNLKVILIEKPLKSGHLCTSSTFYGLKGGRCRHYDCLCNYNHLLDLKCMHNQTCVQRPTLGLKTLAVVQKRPLFRGWSLKITTNIEKLGIILAGVESWPLFRGGR
jgi:hypothetical protein